jgi:adenylate kinase family enzyme
MMQSKTPDEGLLPTRVLFYGVTGSGKSSAARRYARVTGLPEFSVDDDIGWLPGWKPRELDEERAIAAGIAAQDHWVLDSVYSRWSDLVFPRAQVIVALDYPRWISLFRLLRRTTRRILTQESVCNGNTESVWNQFFTGDSIIRWHFQSFARKRRAIQRFSGDPTMPPVLVFHHPKHLAGWFAELESANQHSVNRPQLPERPM